MDITQALAETLRAEKAIRKVTLPAMAKAAGVSRASVIRKLDGERETKIRELRGFAQALGTTASALMKLAEDRLAAIGRTDGRTDGPTDRPTDRSSRNRKRRESEGQLEIPARPGDDELDLPSPDVLEARARARVEAILSSDGVVQPAERVGRGRRSG